MGFNNPEVTWRELERRLSGRPNPNGDGGDSPAWSHKRMAYEAPPLPRPGAPVPYGELHAHSSFSFLDGASAPEELVEEAVRLGLEALTLTDHDGVYGVVRFAEAARAHGLLTGFGAQLSLDAPLPSTQAQRSTPPTDHRRRPLPPAPARPPPPAAPPPPRPGPRPRGPPAAPPRDRHGPSP